MGRNLLYVDDQPDNIVVFRAAFKKKFDLLEATSADEALELFKVHDIPVMVADQRMPDMTGVELCEVVAREYPHTVRMILTGYTDPEDMMDAINKGHVYNFVTKPWKRETLHSVLVRGLEAHDLAVSNSALLERVDHADRCATLGRFTAGMAHEMKNQLFVLPLVELLEEKCPDDEELLKLAAIARQTHHRLAELIDEVMDFVRQENQSFARTPLNLADVAREAVSLAGMDEQIPKRCLKLKVRAEPVILCHRAKLQQVVFNLLKNAAHAVRHQENQQITITIDRQGSEAILSVVDNGPGIPPDILERIWDSFFSTKGPEGNGLGLDMCRRIVEAHGGTICCQSRPGRGARFTVQISVHEGSPEA
ncbi:MAG: hybrid sensor histidine kinase/response regulator [bacterium]|nr:hybrid sensor histidine kinase/response regulator [bacterium]